MSIDFKTELGKIKILMLKGEKGDAGQDGSSGDYSGLTNKPTINGVTVNGAMTSSDLALASQTAVDNVTNDLQTLDNNIYTKNRFAQKTGSKSLTANTSGAEILTQDDVVTLLGLDSLDDVDFSTLKDDLIPIALGRWYETDGYYYTDKGLPPSTNGIAMQVYVQNNNYSNAVVIHLYNQWSSTKTIYYNVLFLYVGDLS